MSDFGLSVGQEITLQLEYKGGEMGSTTFFQVRVSFVFSFHDRSLTLPALSAPTLSSSRRRLRTRTLPASALPSRRRRSMRGPAHTTDPRLPTRRLPAPRHTAAFRTPHRVGLEVRLLALSNFFQPSSAADLISPIGSWCHCGHLPSRPARPLHDRRHCDPSPQAPAKAGYRRCPSRPGPGQDNRI
jgi:hypothetical protein